MVCKPSEYFLRLLFLYWVVVNLSLTIFILTESFVIYNMKGWAFDEELGKCYGYLLPHVFSSLG